MRTPLLSTSSVCFAVWLASGTASADLVLLLPAEGRVPGKALTEALAHETRYAIMELGHTLVSDVEVEAAVRQVADGKPDNADEFEPMARNTKAAWVVAPIISSDSSAYRLEMIAYFAKTGRTESVARDIDTNVIHQQVLEMGKILLTKSGVGTGALPWESAGPLTNIAAPGQPSSPGPGQSRTPEGPGPRTASTGLRPLVGVTLGAASALARPRDATGKSTSIEGGLRAGLELQVPLELGINLRSNLSGPKATSVDASARYWFTVTEIVRLAPEIAPGVFFMGGGAQDTSFLMRFTVIGSVFVTKNVAVEAHVGDLTWVPASNGTLVLGGATLGGTAYF